MIPRPQKEDFKIIGYYLGKIAFGLGVMMLIPLALGLAYGETNPSLDFLISISLTLSLGMLLTILCHTERDPKWMHGMVIVSLSWLVAMFLGAVPLYLSGHFKSYLDACFDAMSGFATTGLTLVQNLDHLSYSHNLWRHLIMFIGGQGIVIVALSFLVRGAAGAFSIYAGEAREERILPNVISTARFIWLVSITYLILGTSVLTFVAFYEGIPLKNSLFHGVCIFIAAFDTGGFTPQSQSILYYHSFLFEITTIVIMLLGALNFKLHYAIWSGNKAEIRRNIETITLFITIMATFIITAFGLKQFDTYPHAIAFFRKGFYQLISSHSGTGYMTIYAKQFIKEWGPLALVGITIAMAFGGSTCSTTGGIKALRLGIIFKAMAHDIRRIILPESAVVIGKFHHIKEIVLGDKQVRSACLITLAYIALYVGGAIVGMCLGYPFLDSLFESTSASANVGLSCGITAASMPTLLKITYMFQMWAGRLEFVAIFTLAGFFIAAVKGK
ncbi:MAG: TrkH family potassium uptake protein [Candidatus Omnitrophota bacterium]